MINIEAIQEEIAKGNTEVAFGSHANFESNYIVLGSVRVAHVMHHSGQPDKLTITINGVSTDVTGRDAALDLAADTLLELV